MSQGLQNRHSAIEPGPDVDTSVDEFFADVDHRSEMMRRAFNLVMRVVSSLIGLLLVLMGVIWILQGLNLAWGALSRSFMQGDQHWALYGAIVVIIGVCQIIWSNTRQDRR